MPVYIYVYISYAHLLTSAAELHSSTSIAASNACKMWWRASVDRVENESDNLVDDDCCVIFMYNRLSCNFQNLQILDVYLILHGWDMVARCTIWLCILHMIERVGGGGGNMIWIFYPEMISSLLCGEIILWNGWEGRRVQKEERLILCERAGATNKQI